MGLLDKLRGKTEKQEDDQAVNTLATAQVYTRPRDSATDAETRNDKGIDYDMVFAEQAVNKLNDLAYTERWEWKNVPAEDKDGNVVFEPTPALDSLGHAIYQDEPLKVGDAVLTMQRAVMVSRPKMAQKLVKVTETHVWAMAALVYLDTVFPTIWMGSWEADTAKLYIRAAFIDIRQQMRADPLLTFQQKQECVVLLTAVRDLALFRCEDTKEGRKALLLKVRREELGVHMSRGNPAGFGGNKQ